MLFSLEYDDPYEIGFYLVPDTGGSQPVVRIVSDGVELRTLAANVHRPELVNSGRHATGMCGFFIDETVVPGLTGLSDLEFVEAESGLLIYRRAKPSHIQVKLFRLETHLLPLWRIDDTLKDRFQCWYKSIDRRGFETCNQILCTLHMDSMYASGRLLFKNIEHYLNAFRSVVIFRDPYEELAERLIILKSVTPKTAELLGPRDMMIFEPVIQALSEVEQFDEASCRRFFKRAPAEVVAPLSNPLIRQLTAGSPDDMPKKTSIAQALAALSSFEIIGLRSGAAEFSQALGETLGLPPGTLPVMNEYARVRELGARLRAIDDVEGILEYDLNIYQQTQQAFGSVAGAGASAG